MGRQVNFFLLPNDFADLQVAIESAGPVRFLQDRTKTQQLRKLNSLVIPPDEMGKTGLRVYATRPNDVDQIKLRWIEQQNHWIVDSLDSPVVEIDRCYYDSHLIRRGRVYFATDLRFRPHLPDEEFTKWGSSVISRIRRRLILNRDIHSFCYVSESVKRWLDDREGSLRGDTMISDHPDANDPYARALAARS
jgi:hypothetical protein